MDESCKSTLVRGELGGGGVQKQMCDSLACWITQVAATSFSWHRSPSIRSSNIVRCSKILSHCNALNEVEYCTLHIVILHTGCVLQYYCLCGAFQNWIATHIVHTQPFEKGSSRRVHLCGALFGRRSASYLSHPIKWQVTKVPACYFILVLSIFFLDLTLWLPSALPTHPLTHQILNIVGWLGNSGGRRKLSNIGAGSSSRSCRRTCSDFSGKSFPPFFP